jgi:TonB family protein
VTLQEDDALERIVTEEADSSSFTIEGPASKRVVLYKPTWFPEVNIDVEVDIRLKFWVLPDGSVGEVLPLQRGDVRLERAAIEYLKNWRFTPVSSDRPQVWGIIPIKYKFQ